MITLLIFLLILSVLVLIHELGHFIVAKKLGIKVEEFGFGFPPRLISIKRGETLYSINALPIGGFVKLYGEDEAGGGKLKVQPRSNWGQSEKLKVSDEKRAFYARTSGQRAAVVVAGVVMNVFLAAFLFYLFFAVSNFKTSIPLVFGERKFFMVNQETKTELIISAVSKDSPAEKAGIAPYTKIVSINNQPVADLKEFIGVINVNKGKEVQIESQNLNTNEKRKVTVIPRVSPPKNQGALGVGFFPVSTALLSYDTPVQKLLSGFTHPTNLMIYNFEVMAKLVGVSFQKKTAAPIGDAVSGPVGIYSIVSNVLQIQSGREKVLQILNLAGILSMSLAFFNVLPIPALDGGRLFFILFEMIVRRKVNPKFEAYAHSIGMAILLSLIFLITFKDIAKLFTGRGLIP